MSSVEISPGITYYCIAWNAWCATRYIWASFTLSNSTTNDPPPTNPDAPKNGKTPISKEAMLASSVAGSVMLVVLALVVGGILCYRRKKLREAQELGEYASVKEGEGDVLEEVENDSENGTVLPTLSPVYVATNVPY